MHQNVLDSCWEIDPEAKSYSNSNQTSRSCSIHDKLDIYCDQVAAPVPKTRLGQSYKEQHLVAIARTKHSYKLIHEI